MDRYNIGQVVTAKEDIETVDAVSNESYIIKNGTIGWVAKYRGLPVICLEDGNYFALDAENTNFVGFDTEGIAELIVNRLKNNPFAKNIEEDPTVEDLIKTTITIALEDIGFYPGDSDEF